MDDVVAKPLVSIGLPVYNAQDFIGATLDSLLAQDYRNFELIISDNCSTDKTSQICLEYEARDSRIKFHRNSTNLGAAPNFERVWALAIGKYFMWAGAHDLWGMAFVSRCLEVLEQDESLVLCYPEAAWIDTEGNILEMIKTGPDTRSLDRISRYFVSMWAIDNRYVVYGLFRTAALRRATVGKSAFGADIILLNEMSLIGGFTYVPELLFFLRKMPDHGDFHAFLEKLNRPLLSRWSAWRIFGEMVYHQLRTVRKQVYSFTEKTVLMLVTLFCIPYKYWPDFKAMRAAASRKKPLSADGSPAKEITDIRTNRAEH